MYRRAREASLLTGIAHTTKKPCEHARMRAHVLSLTRGQALHHLPSPAQVLHGGMPSTLAVVPRLEGNRYMGPPRSPFGAPRARGTFALALGHDRCSTTEKGALIGSCVYFGLPLRKTA